MIQVESIEVPGFAPRKLRTYVPRGAGQGAPLLLMLDGQNVFDDEPSYAGGWHAHGSVEKLASRRPRPVVVGLDHGGHDRLHELSPWVIRGHEGRADAFLGWVARSLVPRLRERHAIAAGSVGVLIGGSSMGGLAALYAHLRFPGVFGGALAMSPSLWVGAQPMLELARSAPKPWISKIYVDAGEHEARGSTARLNEAFAAELRGRGYDADHLRVLVDRRGGHNEPSWRRRLLSALRWFYPLPPPRRRSRAVEIFST